MAVDNDVPLPSMAELLTAAANSKYYTGEGPFRMNLDHLRPDVPIHLAVGSNSAGKSFLVRTVSRLARAHPRRPFPQQISMAQRARGGVEAVMMAGKESEQSTGLTSIGVVRRGISSMRGWGTNLHYAIFDEPDLGLADVLAHPLGQYIGQFGLAPAPGTLGTLVITHSRMLVEGLRKSFQEVNKGELSYVLLGDAFASLEDFMTPRRPYTIEEMLEIADNDIDARRAIWALDAD